MQSEPSCIFCRIVQGDAPSFRVCEDDLTLTFLDIFPVADGHTLVVTKEHFENLYEADAKSIAAVGTASLRVATAIRGALRPDGLAVYQANGAAAGQTVFHYHMHLIPRAQGTQLAFHGRRRADSDRLRELAASLAGALPRD